MKLTLFVALLLIALAAAASDEPSVAGETNCVDISRIDRTRILDDSTILFYMRGPDIFINRLPKRCAGLRNAGTFSYRTSLTRLCNVDIINVLRQTGGQFMPGPSCGLGMFQPITAEAIEELTETPRVEPEGVEPEIVDPDADADADEAPADSPSG